MSSCFILRRRHPGVSQIFAHAVDSLSVQFVAVVRTMQDAFDSIQPHPHTRTREGFHCCSQVMQEGLDIPPMNIAARGITKDSANKVFVFVSHN